MKPDKGPLFVGGSAIFWIALGLAAIAYDKTRPPLELVEQCGPVLRVIVDPNDEPDLYRVQVADIRNGQHGRVRWRESFASWDRDEALSVCRQGCPGDKLESCDTYAGAW